MGYGIVGGSFTFGGLLTLAGLVGSQPDSWTNLKNVLKSLDEKAAEQPQHCRREDGTERKWFDTAPEAASWKAAHPKSYGSDEIMYTLRRVPSFAPFMGGVSAVGNPGESDGELIRSSLFHRRISSVRADTDADFCGTGRAE